MFQRIRSIIRNAPDDGEQRQREALIDLLLWVMYADESLSLPENQMLGQLEDGEWSGVMPPRQYVNAALARVRDVLGDQEKTTAFLEQVAERLGTPEMRQHAYDAACDFAQVDGDVSSKEHAFLRQTHRTFALPEPDLPAR